jgi:hypothetical protein
MELSRWPSVCYIDPDSAEMLNIDKLGMYDVRGQFTSDGKRYAQCVRKTVTVVCTETNVPIASFKLPTDQNVTWFGNKYYGFTTDVQGQQHCVIDYMVSDAIIELTAYYGYFIKLVNNDKIFMVDKIECLVVSGDTLCLLYRFACPMREPEHMRFYVSENEQICATFFLGELAVTNIQNGNTIIARPDEYGTGITTNTLVAGFCRIVKVGPDGQTLVAVHDTSVTVVYIGPNTSNKVLCDVDTMPHVCYVSSNHLLVGYVRGRSRAYLSLVHIPTLRFVWTVQTNGGSKHFSIAADKDSFAASSKSPRCRCIEVRSMANGTLLKSSKYYTFDICKIIRTDNNVLCVAFQSGFVAIDVSVRWTIDMYQQSDPVLRANVRTFFRATWRWLPNDLIGVVMDYWKWHATFCRSRLDYGKVWEWAC